VRTKGEFGAYTQERASALARTGRVAAATRQTCAIPTAVHILVACAAQYYNETNSYRFCRYCRTVLGGKDIAATRKSGGLNPLMTLLVKG
jgi:hypothetical protein